MKIGHRAKFGLLIALLLGGAALLWQRLGNLEPASPAGTPLDQPPVFQTASRWAESDPVQAKAWLDANAHQPRAETARAGYDRSVPEAGDDLISR